MTDIGLRVREIRTRQNLTLDQLATNSGLSRRVIINIEKGETSPNIATLLRLSEHLQITLPELVSATNPASQNDSVETGTLLWSGPNGGTGTLLTSVTTSNVVEIWSWRMQPSEVHKSEPHISGSQEILHVLSGSLTVSARDEVLLIETGQTFTFQGDQIHSYENNSAQEAWFSLTVIEPLVEQLTRKVKSNV